MIDMMAGAQVFKDHWMAQMTSAPSENKQGIGDRAGTVYEEITDYRITFGRRR